MNLLSLLFAMKELDWWPCDVVVTCQTEVIMRRILTIYIHNVYIYVLKCS